MGTRKLYKLLQLFLVDQSKKIGRDRLFDVLLAHNLLIRRKKRQTIITNSLHRFKKYSNLVKNFIPNASNQLWVSDITYWKIEKQLCLYKSNYECLF
ncbi:hypothetical protein U6A24_07875 [Aquimarina gracilis]|uniref:Helix-turn-helix protein n=1 Tax=Aquimarina gracilis TaxID=874422 RepID=A0ABU5ZTG9_9FLAO|nr:hypothetical protein [Aquimarina gracilis]MEB3345371.1 hypothetical protein [Aquimarina gracilis]